MLNVGGFFVGHVWPQDLPDPHTVSSSIQQMWALTEVMQTQQTTASVGRFDVGLFDFLYASDKVPCQWLLAPPIYQLTG